MIFRWENLNALLKGFHHSCLNTIDRGGRKYQIDCNGNVLMKNLGLQAETLTKKRDDVLMVVCKMTDANDVYDLKVKLE